MDELQPIRSTGGDYHHQQVPAAKSHSELTGEKSADVFSIEENLQRVCCSSLNGLNMFAADVKHIFISNQRAGEGRQTPYSEN